MLSNDAKAERSDFTVWEAVENVVPTKEWTITFSQRVDQATLNDQNIYVKDQNGEKVAVDIKQKANSAVVVTPKRAYQPGNEYALFITENVRSHVNNELTEAVKMPFTIQEVVELQGSYQLEEVTLFSNDFSVNSDLQSASYFNVFRNGVAIDEAVAIDSKLRSLPMMFSDLSILEVRFYDDHKEVIAVGYLDDKGNLQINKF